MEVADKRHYAAIDPYNRQLTVTYNGQVLARTTKALILKEVAKSVYDPVFYIPKEDLTIELEAENKSSYCPIKGDASYWNLLDDHVDGDYFIWSYEDPHPRSKKIKGMVAFNSNLVSFLSEPMPS